MGPSCKIYALKRIRLAGRDVEAASGFIDEINLLLRLRNKPNIIQLIDSQVGSRACYSIQLYTLQLPEPNGHLTQPLLLKYMFSDSSQTWACPTVSLPPAHPTTC